MANARIWKLIEEVLDGRMQPLRNSLVWMPAHTSVDMCGSRQRSDLRNITPVDWRANQLADILAKAAAPEDAARKIAKRVIDTAQEALVHSAVRLGAVTYAANNSPEVLQLTGGTTSTVMRRDSTSLPQRSNSAKTERKLASKRKRKEPPPVCSPSWVSTSAQAVVSARTWRQSKSRAEREQAAKRRRADSEVLATAVASAAGRLTQPANQLPAAARMAALQERIRMCPQPRLRVREQLPPYSGREPGLFFWFTNYMPSAVLGT